MSTLRKFWLPWVTTIILACASDAVAQAGYKVADLGTLGNDNMSCAMTLIGPVISEPDAMLVFRQNPT